MRAGIRRTARSLGLRGVLVGTVALCCAAPAGAQTGSVVSDDVTLHYWPGQERLALALRPTPQALRFEGLPDDILRMGTRIDVYLAPDAARWDSLTGGRAPEWGAGIAMPYQNKVVIPGFVSRRASTYEVPQILRHELAHIALHRYVDSALLPRWFNEGYAMWSAGQFNADAGWKLRLGFVTRRAPPLDSLSLDWPLIAADAELAYLLSASAVRYLHSLGTPAMFQQLLQTWHEGNSFENALRKVFVLSSPQFERQWRRHVRREYGWTQVIAQTAFIWIVLTLAVMVLFAIRRRRDRKKLALLRATEPPDEPAFWVEPPAEPEEPAEPDDGSRS